VYVNARGKYSRPTAAARRDLRRSQSLRASGAPNRRSDPGAHARPWHNEGVPTGPTSRKSDVAGATNYVRAALQAVTAGQPVKTPVARAYGCTVKYP
jgi:hypothetical protein